MDEAGPGSLDFEELGGGSAFVEKVGGVLVLVEVAFMVDVASLVDVCTSLLVPPILPALRVTGLPRSSEPGAGSVNPEGRKLELAPLLTVCQISSSAYENLGTAGLPFDRLIIRWIDQCPPCSIIIDFINV